MIAKIVIIVILKVKVANKITKKGIQMKEKCPICGNMFDFWKDNILLLVYKPQKGFIHG